MAEDMEQKNSALQSGGSGGKDYLDYLKNINDTFSDQIKMADQKAAYIFTFLIAFVISSTEGRNAFSLQRYASGNPLTILFSGLLAAALIVAMVSSIMVVLPRVRRAATTALFWGAWHEHRASLTEAMRREDPDYIAREYLGNIDNLSTIAVSKYRHVGMSFRALLASVVAYVLLLLVS